MATDSRQVDKELPYLVTPEANGRCLWNAIAGNALPKGLILITGSTGSGKTSFLNALVAEILNAVCSNLQDPTPHIIAVGDPVETELLDVEAQRQNLDLPFRFTARTIKRDVESIEWAMRDALRQTPTAFIISELREKDEFRATLRFAETGHLVLATAHATSLIDAMARLMSVEKVTSPSGRALLGQRLAAIVYLRPYEFHGSKSDGRYSIEPYQIKLPRIWRGNTNGRRAFVSDGLSSLHVAAPSPGGHAKFDSKSAGVLGYYGSVSLLKESAPRADDTRWKHLFQVAHRLDLFQDPA